MFKKKCKHQSVCAAQMQSRSGNWWPTTSWNWVGTWLLVAAMLALHGMSSAQTVLFSDDFTRTSGLGSNWNVWNGSYTTDGANAVSGTMTPSGTGNWASVVPAVNTNNYAVSADIMIPPGSQDSGIVVRGSNTAFDSDLYSAQMSPTGLTLFRRNGYTWTQLGSYAVTIQANTFYTLQVEVSGSSPVHLTVWLTGVSVISVDDSSANRITAGVPGIVNYAGNVQYSVFKVLNMPAPIFSEDFDRNTGLGTNWQTWDGSYTTDGANAVSGTMTTSGTGNWASVTPSMNTNNYSVVANLTVPAGSQDSGVVIRGSNTTDFTSDLYSAQISTSGSVNLYRRNGYNWTLLDSYSTPVQAGVSHGLKLLIIGDTPDQGIGLEVWFDGVKVITFVDTSPDAITVGAPGIVNYDGNVKYDSFGVYVGLH